MNNYDFLVLSPNEFEHLTRDLLQKKLDTFIESFKIGRDGGIDLKCSKKNQKKIIIQAKRYESYNNLISNLKKEVNKVKNLNPDRYIISTTVGLTPGNKEDIVKLFEPYILQTEDILGKDDLSNLLNTYKDIELKYYKLWLTSTNILQTIFKSKIYNQSIFELDEIRKHIQLYVQNDSFNEAIEILKKHRYIIISGIPGIGKTTLARVLSLYLLSNGSDDFVYLNDSIDEGYGYFEKEKKQIFFFDDFLGKNFFENRFNKNEDSNIIRFINVIKNSNNKFLILTTREYILSQAKISLEAFKINNIEIAKCILDLESYTNIIRAKILYNHLFFANLPVEYLKDLMPPKKHLAIVKHQNYNPRIIETILNENIWINCKPTEFSNKIKSYFDNPESVWLYTFENSLKKLSQYTLFVLLTMGTPVILEDLEKALISFLKTNQLIQSGGFDSIIFLRLVKELENTFIRTHKDLNNKILINYQNPSIQDFLINYFRYKNDLISNLFESAIFQEQFITIFTSTLDIKKLLIEKIYLSEDLRDLALLHINNKFSTLKCCRISKFDIDGSNLWFIDSNKKYQFLNIILNELSGNKSNVQNIVNQKFKELIYFKEESGYEQDAYMKLLFNIDLEEINFQKDDLIRSFLNTIHSSDQFELFLKFENLFPHEFKKIINEDSFKNKIFEVIQADIDYTEEPNMGNLYDDIENISEKYKLNLDDYLSKLSDKIADYETNLDPEYQIGDEIGSFRNNETDEDKVIAEIFNNLARK